MSTKMKKVLFGLALLPLFFSCNGATHVFYLSHSGDLASSKKETATYESVCSRRDVSSLLAESDLGHPILLALTSKNCPHCLDFESAFTQFVIDNQLDVSLLEHNEGDVDLAFNEGVSAIQSHFSEAASSQLSTPSILYFCQNDFRFFQIGQTDLVRLENTLKGQAKPISGLTRYEKEADIPYAASVPLFLYDGNFGGAATAFYEQVWSLAKTSEKVMSLVDYGAMDESNQQALLAHYSLTKYEPLLLSDNIPYPLGIQKEMTDAISLIKAYYQ